MINAHELVICCFVTSASWLYVKAHQHGSDLVGPRLFVDVICGRFCGRDASDARDLLNSFQLFESGRVCN